MILKTEQVEERMKSKNNLAKKKLNGNIIREMDFSSESNTLPQESELKTNNNTNNNVEILPVNHLERKPFGATKIPDSVKQVLAITANQSNESAVEFASVFGVSSTTVNDIRRGLVGNRKDEVLTTFRNQPAPPAPPQSTSETETEAETVNESKAGTANLERIEEKRLSAHDLALDSLVTTLQTLKPKLAALDKPKELAVIAGGLSKVVANVAASKKYNEEEEKKDERPRIVLFAPVIKNESHYEVIEA